MDENEQKQQRLEESTLHLNKAIERHGELRREKHSLAEDDITRRQQLEKSMSDVEGEIRRIEADRKQMGVPERFPPGSFRQIG